MVEVGVDEAGVGPAYGSVWAAAVHVPRPVEGVRDSKTLSERRRDAFRNRILAEEGVAYGLGEVTYDEIDRLGLAEARRLVFDRALDDYAARDGPTPTKILVDGSLFRPWRDVPYECHDRADALFPCVSAASILAKTSRDAQVRAWCEEDPTLHERYALKSNKGYLSTAHVEGLRTHGYSARHRRSYHIRALPQLR